MKPKVKNDPCYACLHLVTYTDENAPRCLITTFTIDQRTLNLCKIAGWKRTRWTHAWSRRKQPHYPPAL